MGLWRGIDFIAMPELILKPAFTKIAEHVSCALIEFRVHGWERHLYKPL